MPSGIVVQAGKVGVCIDPGATDRVIYWIDEFAGARTEIALYTEGQSAATYNLYDAVLDERVHGIRGFKCNLNTDFDYVILEIDGKIYMPYDINDEAETLINWNDSEFEYAGDCEMKGFVTMVPKLAVEITEQGGAITLPSFNNLQILSEDIIAIDSISDIISNHVDGILFTEYGCIICINGKYTQLSVDGTTAALVATPENAAWVGMTEDNQLTNIYDSRLHAISEEGRVIVEGQDLATAKENAEEDLGITIEDGYILIESDSADSMPAIWGIAFD